MTVEIATATDEPPPGAVDCWCCGRPRPESDVVRLGGRPEVAVCLRCAHFLHQKARAREDARRPTAAARVRNGLRAGRRVVMARGWHRAPLIGAVLRRLGPRLP